ncbi:MAG: hypothetical protein K9H49_19745 [Bacteroidales bacterium]|nr:hypothetical protein [Bacteroidales bacterium]
MKTIALYLSISLITSSLSFTQTFNGTYSYTSDEATLTLSLQEVSGSVISGTLQSTKGISYQVQGEIMGGVAMGVCFDDQSGVYFEASLEGTLLTLGLIEADAFNMPDYNTARYYVFEKKALGGEPQIQKVQPQIIKPGEQTPNPQASPSLSSVSSPKTGSSDIAGNETGDPSWGWKFIPPNGWQSQKNQEGIFLGHNTIAGLIMMLPHRAENMQQLQQEMIKGISEEGNYLSLSGTLNSLGGNLLEGEYTGVMDGTNVKARGIGTLSPFGGGAYIIAVTTPDKYGNELKNAAGSIAQSLSYFKSSGGELMPHFAGKWTNYTKNTSTFVTLYPDGSYGEQYESSYSSDPSQDVSWGTAGQSNRAGRWTVKGSKEQGQIIVNLNNGNEIVYNYRVHVANGQTYYSEYYFNGELYGKSRIE